MWLVTTDDVRRVALPGRVGHCQTGHLGLAEVPSRSPFSDAPSAAPSKSIYLVANVNHADTVDQLRVLIDWFVDEYNHRRPQRSLGRTTPAVAYGSFPKAGLAGWLHASLRCWIRPNRIDRTGAASLR